MTPVFADAWTERLKIARTEAEVMALARDFLASFDDYELRFLPPRCQSRVLLCANDISTYAFDLVAHRCEEMDASARLVRRLAEFFTGASIRLSEITVGVHPPAARRTHAAR
jgi:hypothetical protein